MSSKNPFDGLEPRVLWAHFADFTKIARPSTKEGQMADHIAVWAQSRPGFEAKKDAAGNLRVRVPASAGREKASTVILQGHMDMVCVRDDAAGPYDPAQGKIRVFRARKKGDEFVEAEDGDWIKADKTTLGADDGVGVAAMLTVCEDRTVPHGPLELLFTVEEETGLTGAFKLDPSLLTGKTYLNLDSEEDGILTIGSAGGRNTTLDSAEKPLYRIILPPLALSKTRVG